MSEWDEKAQAVATALYPDDSESHWRKRAAAIVGFRNGVSAALTWASDDDAVERAARTITPELYYHYDEWDDANEEDRARALKMARTALTAALDV